MMNMDSSVFVQAVPVDVHPRLINFSKEERVVSDEVTKWGTNGATLKQLKRVGLRPNALNTIIADLSRNRCIQAFKPIRCVKQRGVRVSYLHVWSREREREKLLVFVLVGMCFFLKP